MIPETIFSPQPLILFPPPNPVSFFPANTVTLTDCMVYVLLISFLGIKGEWECLVPLLKTFKPWALLAKFCCCFILAVARSTYMSECCSPARVCPGRRMPDGLWYLEHKHCAQGTSRRSGCNFDEGPRAFALSAPS